MVSDAGPLGIEPRLTVLETVVLPLYDGPLLGEYTAPFDKRQAAYFFTSLCFEETLHHLQYFFNSILRVTSLRFLRDQ